MRSHCYNRVNRNRLHFKTNLNLTRLLFSSFFRCLDSEHALFVFRNNITTGNFAPTKNRQEISFFFFMTFWILSVHFSDFPCSFVNYGRQTGNISAIAGFYFLYFFFFSVLPLNITVECWNVHRTRIILPPFLEM